MCIMCKGATQEDVVRRLHAKVTDHGFGIVPVGRRQEDRGWAYTVGLVDRADHPELVVAGYPLVDAVAVLDDLARLVVAGERVDVDAGPIAYRGVPVGTLAVHPWHIRRGLMSVWHWYYDSIGRRDLDPRALQLVLPDGTRCHQHQISQPRLDRARHVTFDGGPPGYAKHTAGDPRRAARPRGRNSRPRPPGPTKTSSF